MFSVLMIMWAIELITELLSILEDNYTGKVLADAIKIISAAIIAQCLLVNPKVREYIIGKYISLKNHFEEESEILV